MPVHVMSLTPLPPLPSVHSPRYHCRLQVFHTVTTAREVVLCVQPFLSTTPYSLDLCFAAASFLLVSFASEWVLYSSQHLWESTSSGTVLSLDHSPSGGYPLSWSTSSCSDPPVAFYGCLLLLPKCAVTEVPQDPLVRRR